MEAVILAIEKVVLGAMRIARIFKFKQNDESEEAIMNLIDGIFEKLFGNK